MTDDPRTRLRKVLANIESASTFGGKAAWSLVLVEAATEVLVLLDDAEVPLAALRQAVADVDAESTGSPFRQAAAFAATNAARRLLEAIGLPPDPPEPEPRIVSAGVYAPPRPESVRYGGGHPLGDYLHAKGER